MRIIKELSRAIECNIGEAGEKIAYAYAIKDKSPQAAAWYKEMAAAHLGFNSAGHAAVAKLIAEYRDSEEYKAHPEYADGMMAVWQDRHAELTRKTAEVQAMIATFK